MGAFGLILLLTSFLSAPAWAKEGNPSPVDTCLSDYRLIANVSFGPKLGRKEGFKFKDEQMIFDRTMKLNYTSLPGRVIQAEFQRISEQDKYLREHIKLLKRETSRPNRPQREMQEFIVVYRDGSRKSVRYTSNQFHEVSQKAGEAAIAGSKIFNDQVEIVLDIHTHPDQGLRSDLFLSADDVIGSQLTKQSIERAIGRSIDYHVIVAPTCDNCDNVILTSQF